MTKPAARPAYEVPATVLAREVDGQMVLLALHSEQYYGLDEVGAAILTRLLEQPYDQALDSLVADYDVPEQVLRGDVEVLVTRLLDAGLLQPTGS